MVRPRLLLAAALGLVLCLSAGAAPAGAVIGGRPAVDGEGPWMVALVDRDARRHPVQGQYCGGALIGPRTVLTAAHCLVFGGRPLVVRSRVLPQDARRNSRLAADVTRLVVHPRFRPSFEEESQLGDPNDIGLLRLRRALPGPYLRTVVSGDEPAWAPGVPLRVFGWGNRSRIGPNLPRQLHTGTITRFSDATCDGHYGRGFDAGTMFCAGATDGSVDTCEGDSGGPVVGTDAMGRDVLVGLVSFGFECGLAEFPGVYTRVSRYQAYLASHPERRDSSRSAHRG